MVDLSINPVSYHIWPITEMCNLIPTRPQSVRSHTSSYIPCPVKPLLSPWSSLPGGWDAICLVDALVPATLASDFDACRAVDKVFDKEVSCFRSTGTNSAATFGARIVYAPIGVLDDFDDVRVYERAAGRAIARAIKAGARKPLLVLPAASGRFPHAAQSTLLGALQELYVPIQYREAVADKRQQVQTLGVWSLDDGRAAAAAWERAQQIERARFVARDIGGGDPERMAPPNVRFYLQQLFADRPNITIRVVDALADLERDYPLFAAVNRAAAAVPRHRGCIVFVEYTPPEAARKSLLLVGKGVTYDTGGADIKAGGVMAGMSRDKCGAAAVAGFMQLVAERQPKDVAVIGALCLVRNSVGEECYVSDEVIAARSGVRVRVGNTDAEGRMCMSDALYEVSGFFVPAWTIGCTLQIAKPNHINKQKRFPISIMTTRIIVTGINILF